MCTCTSYRLFMHGLRCLLACQLRGWGMMINDIDNDEDDDDDNDEDDDGKDDGTIVVP